MKLVRFLMKCQNESVTVELKNGSCASGTVASVATNMNVALRNVKFSPKSRPSAPVGATVQLDMMNIRGNTIRYIILPDSLNLDSLLVDDAAKPKNKARKEAAEKAGGRGGRGSRGGPRMRGGGRRGGGRGRGF